MTAAQIQTYLSSAPCVANLTRGQLQWLIVILLWQGVNGGPMTADDIQSLFDSSPCVGNLMEGQLQQLEVILLGLGGGGGGGLIAPDGANFCFSGLAPNQELKIKNLDTGLANRIDTRLADPNQALLINDGSAC